MNTGLERSTSKYVWFMNAGDIFASNLVLEYSLNLIQKMGVGVLIGGYAVGGGKIETYVKRRRKIGAKRFSSNVRSGCHQSMIFLRSATPQSGYDLKFELASDFDFILQTIEKSGAYRTNIVLSTISPGGVTHSRIGDVLKEKQLIRKKMFGTFSVPYFFGFYISFGVKAKSLFRIYSPFPKK